MATGVVNERDEQTRDALVIAGVHRARTTLEAARESKLFRGTRLAHGDFHNHTLLSDGAGDPAVAFESMRRAGLDVAAITDHALYRTCDDESAPAAAGYLRTLSEAGWRQVAELAAKAERGRSFVALRGFEWTSPRLGHMNAWFSTNWIDTLSTGGYRIDDPVVASLPPTAVERAGGQAALALGRLPMEAWYRWLQTPVDDGGGLDALVGFNHPGREPGRFGEFELVRALRQRLVSMEIFNREDDYLLRGREQGRPSPLVQCLEAGWRVGLLGVSDDHSANWGFTDGYGRTGLWLTELTREGVREALLSRRFFATRQRGLRLDVAANGVRMGSTLSHRGGRISLVVDLDGGSDSWGTLLNLQILGRGDDLPSVKWAGPVVVPGEDQPPIQVDLELEADETPWLLVRISDPNRCERSDPPTELERYGTALAYASPFYVEPAVRDARAAVRLNNAGWGH